MRPLLVPLRNTLLRRCLCASSCQNEVGPYLLRGVVLRLCILSMNGTRDPGRCCHPLDHWSSSLHHHNVYRSIEMLTLRSLHHLMYCLDG